MSHEPLANEKTTSYFGEPMSLQAHLFLAELFNGARGDATQGGVVFSIANLSGRNHTLSKIDAALENRHWEYAIDENEGTLTLTSRASQRLAASFGAEFEGSKQWAAGGMQR
jgi:hypothetical protein